ncbi:MAG: zinc-finger domain-containing protein [Legionellaceae bacterium]|nr:zinc-finger domain-containing protein [Legionellaceae bacterium]
MSKKINKKAKLHKEYMIKKSDLPLSCPTDKMELWNAHPKVYLPIEKTGVEVCPYCSTRFVLQDD